MLLLSVRSPFLNFQSSLFSPISFVILPHIFSRTSIPSQVFLDVDCSDIKYTNSASSLFRDILAEEDNYLRGYSDPSQINKILQNKTGLDDFSIRLNMMLPGKFCEFYGDGVIWVGLAHSRGLSLEERRVYHPWLKEACRRDPKNPLNKPPLPSKYTLPIAENRSQTPEEALQGSLLDFFTWATSEDFSPITAPDIIPSMTAVSRAGWESYLREGFCRSVEPFSEIFDTPQKGRVQTEEGETWLHVPFKDYDDPASRPQSCAKWVSYHVDHLDWIGLNPKYVPTYMSAGICPG